MKKKKLSFPTAFTVLFIVLILSAVLTYIVPAGSYAKLAYNKEDNNFTITMPDGKTSAKPATQQTLDQLGIKIGLNKFVDESINKPVAIPNTYERVKQKPQGIKEVIEAPIQGTYDTIDIIMFILIIGGVIGILNATGTFNAGIASLSKATKGKEYILIILLNVLIVIGGTTFGLAEETIALYPILMPIFLIAGYDAIVCIATIYMGSSIGSMFSTVNPFSSVIASNSAGINFTEGLSFRIIGLVIATIITLVYIIKYANKVKNDPSKSLIYDQKQEIEKRFLNESIKDVPKFTFRLKLMLIIFALAFVVMVYGVSMKGWWFTEMTALFLIVGIILGFISDLNEKEFVNNFVAGAGDLVGVALVIGVARSINLILENGQISDTLLNYFSLLVNNMNGSIFIILMLVIFIILGFFILSYSGLAVLSIPIMAPLADTVGLPRDVIVSAYQFGQGLISFITPTGLILATLAMVDVTYNKWLKFIMPLMIIVAVFAAALLLVQVHF